MNPRRLLSPAAVARILGVHRRTVRRWIDEGEFPAALIGGRWYTRASELAAWEAERFGPLKSARFGTRRH